MARGRIFERVRQVRIRQREESLLGFESFLMEQQQRILTTFAEQELKRNEDRWAEGGWTGREGLEYQEGRK